MGGEDVGPVSHERYAQVGRIGNEFPPAAAQACAETWPAYSCLRGRRHERARLGYGVLGQRLPRTLWIRGGSDELHGVPGAQFVASRRLLLERSWPLMTTNKSLHSTRR